MEAALRDSISSSLQGFRRDAILNPNRFGLEQEGLDAIERIEKAYVAAIAASVSGRRRAGS